MLSHLADNPVAVVWALLLAAMATGSGVTIFRGLRARRWIRASATVTALTRVRLERHRAGAVWRALADVAFATREGSTVRALVPVAARAIDGKDAAYAFARCHSGPGGSVNVWYDPKRPERQDTQGPVNLGAYAWVLVVGGAGAALLARLTLHGW